MNPGLVAGGGQVHARGMKDNPMRREQRSLIMAQS